GRSARADPIQTRALAARRQCPRLARLVLSCRCASSARCRQRSNASRCRHPSAFGRAPGSRIASRGVWPPVAASRRYETWPGGAWILDLLDESAAVRRGQCREVETNTSTGWAVGDDIDVLTACQFHLGRSAATRTKGERYRLAV